MRSRIAALAAVFLFMGLALPAPAAAQAQTPFRAVAKVNQDVITAWDVEQRARILRAIGGAEASDQRLANAALDGLVENRLMLQEGKEAGIEPTRQMIDQGIAELAERAGVAPGDFVGRLEEAGVTRQAIADMVGPQVVWRQVVRQRFQGRVDPGESEIDTEIALAGEQQPTAVRLREIGLAATGAGRSPAETRALAATLVSDLRSGADFGALAREYSASQSAGQGGEVGWVPLDGLPEPISAAVSGLEPGGVTDPIEVQGGVSILQVTDRRTEGQALDAGDTELRERVRRGMVSGRLERLADGLLQELRRDALIQLQ